MSGTASRRLPALPLLVLLIGVAGAAMLAPAGMAFVAGELALAGIFAKAALITAVGAAVLAAATAGYRPADAVRSQFLSLIGAYAVLPPILALPLAEAMPGLGFWGAWFEMVSAFTTTGASLLAPMPETPAPVHLWASLVGWLGGFFVLLAAAALLAPLNLGGLEVANPRPVGKSAFAATPIHAAADPAQRLAGLLRVLAPVYAALTLALWIGLLLAGEAPFPALAHAMGILATSGLSPVGGLEGGSAGRAGEAVMLLFLVFAVTRQSIPGAMPQTRRRGLLRDEELRLACAVVVGLALVFALRGWVGAGAVAEAGSVAEAGAAAGAGAVATAGALEGAGSVAGAGALEGAGAVAGAGVLEGAGAVAGAGALGGAGAIAGAGALEGAGAMEGALAGALAGTEGAAAGLAGQAVAAWEAFWAGLFTFASFLTTTGYVSADWSGGAAAALAGTGHGAAALVLGGLVMVGGGVATTAGGIKLLRIHALWRHGRHEMEKLVQPSLVAGGGERVRHLRSDGAYLAWLAFMLFVLSLAAVTAALGLAGLGFEAALVFAISALSTTGPLAGMAGIAGEPGQAWAALESGPRAILAAAMVLGRLELLAIVALLAPESWRR